MLRHWSTRTIRLLPVAALLLALVVAAGPVAAADPTVTANPALVPFSEAPGLPGATQLTFNANGTGGLTACGQDNGKAPFVLGPLAASGAAVINFPYIQAGVYTFWVSTDSTCAAGTKFLAGGVPVQTTATRLGPNSKAGQDDIAIRYTAFDGPSPAGGPPGRELILAGAVFNNPPKTQVFPIPDARLCIMSGDGAQVSIKVQVGQDARPQGLGAGAITTTVIPFAGQNGCFSMPWIVNGGYVATIARSGVAFAVGFCIGFNTPSDPPTAAGIGKCAQVALFPDPSAGTFPTGTTINGSIVTGADNHAVQVCASAFSPGAGGAPVTQLPNQVSTFNGSGAANLSPLTIPSAFPSKTVIKLSTYDITNPGTPGGTGGTQFTCPPATATQSGSAITAISVPDVPNATIIDSKNYFVA